jgi:hypothetical protein
MDGTSVKEPSSPIFIGGFVRSGTTLLRAMLGQHSRIASGLETHWCSVDWAAGTGRRGEPLVDWLRRMAGFYDFPFVEVEQMAAASDGIKTFLERFLGAYAARFGKSRWAEKTTDNVIHLDRVFALWPHSKFVHIVRDPRDCYVSLAETGKAGDMDSFAQRWVLYLGSAECHKKTLGLGPDRYLEIRYEALVLDPVSTMKAVVDFAGEAWEEQVGGFGGKDGEYEKVLAVTGTTSSTLLRIREPLSTRRIGVWRAAMTAERVRDLDAAIERRGYAALARKLEHASRGLGADGVSPASGPSP